MKVLGLFGVILTEIVIWSLLGFGIGYRLTTRYKAPDWILVLTSMLGLTIGMFRVYWVTTRLQKQDDEK